MKYGNMCSFIRRPNGDRHRNWLVYFDQHYLSRVPLFRRVVTAYFKPNRLERASNGIIYKMLGVQLIAWLIPTGGLLWRRLFKWTGWSFSLIGPSIAAASEYRYSTCVFESLHLFAILLMIPDGVTAMATHCTDGILKFLLAGLMMNGLPILLQRYNRVRIQGILDRAQSRNSSIQTQSDELTVNRPPRLSKRVDGQDHKGISPIFALILFLSFVSPSNVNGKSARFDDRKSSTQDIIELQLTPDRQSCHLSKYDTAKRIAGLAFERCRVMEYAHHLCEKIGPRVSGSTNLKDACNWALQEFQVLGLSDAHMEECGTVFGELLFDFLKIKPTRIHNVIGDIKGSPLPDEFVIVGEHIDSDDDGTGATDNAAGVAAIMEAARLLIKSGAMPRRTIRFILFSGEEQGKVGSRAYIDDHQPHIRDISCMFNLDHGTGYISTLNVTKNMEYDFEIILTQFDSIAHVRHVTARTVSNLSEIAQSCCGSGGTSDHGPFLEAGVPAFQFVQSGLKAEPYPAHTAEDTYDKIVPEYLRDSAVAVAVIALGAANLDHKISRDVSFGNSHNCTMNKGDSK